MNCISISFKLAPREIRSRIAPDKSKQIEFIKNLISNYTDECVMLCTCNRTEIYFDGECQNEILQALCQLGSFDENELGRYVMYFFGHKAIVHLFSLAAGLDSMVVGEDEILRQLKEAYEISVKNSSVSSQFNMIFQSAFACAKKIKSSTSLSTIPVSVATLAANTAAKFTGSSVTALVIGATGKIGLSTLKNLISHKNVTVYATTRNRNKDTQPAAELGVTLYSFLDRYDLVDSSDCIISATSAPHYTLNFLDVKNAIKTKKPRLFIDLAVPPDIDPHISEIEKATLLTIDSFEKIAKQNNIKKEKIALSAKEIIANEVDSLEKELAYHEFLPNLNQASQNEIDTKKLMIALKSELDSSQFNAVIAAISKIPKEEEP